MCMRGPDSHRARWSPFVIEGLRAKGRPSRTVVRCRPLVSSGREAGHRLLLTSGSVVRAVPRTAPLDASFIAASHFSVVPAEASESARRSAGRFFASAVAPLRQPPLSPLVRFLRLRIPVSHLGCLAQVRRGAEVNGWSVGFAAHGHELVWVRFHGEAMLRGGMEWGSPLEWGRYPRWQSRSVTLTGCSRRGRLSGGGLSESRILRSWWQSPGVGQSTL